MSVPLRAWCLEESLAPLGMLELVEIVLQHNQQSHP
jgi:hypothetical protein